MSRGRRATLPEAGMPPLDQREALQPLILMLALEDDPNYKFDLSRMAGPERMRIEIGAAVRVWSASSKGGRRTPSVVRQRSAISAFLRWVDSWADGQATEVEAQPQTLADLTPFHLRRYRSYLQANRAVTTAFEFYSALCILLKVAPEVTEETWREANKRKGAGPAPASVVCPYTGPEVVQIRNAARRRLEQAVARISASYALAQQHEDPACSDPLRAKALHEVILYGRPQSKEGMIVLGANAAAAHRGGESTARRQLFLSPDEVFAAAVLLVCHRGLNLSPIVNASTPLEHEPGVVQLDLDKPRRGPASRFWQEIIVDDEFADTDTGHDARGATTVRLIAEATQPAREYFAAQGQRVQRLLVYWASSQPAPRLGIPSRRCRSTATWVPPGITIDFPRLRRSIPGRGVTKEPTDHSPDVHLHYVRSDPEALMEQQEQAALGIQKLVDHARTGLAIRVAKDQDTNPDTDAVVVNCSDPQRRPDTGRPCTTGFYSFLDCLQCSNAATVPRLLPRVMAALQVIEELRGAMGEAWERRFSRHYYILLAVVGRHTLAERELAAVDVSRHIPLVMAALRHEVPA